VPGLVHIVDDDLSFLTAMERHLRHAGYEVAVYASAQALLDRLPSDSIPSCILLDVQIPDLDGPALQKQLGELGSTLPIIFLSGYRDIPITVRTIKAGAQDFLSKPLNMARARLAKLTPRERQVFDLVVRGKINKQIAHTLGTTERTIKAHRHGLMEKMQVRSLAELVSLAERIGVLDGASDERGTA
jgi:FixJ family two-component response regulator